MEECQYLSSESNPRRCAMHEKLNKVQKDIVTLTTECFSIWSPQMELDVLTNHRLRFKMVRSRSKGEPWRGSKTEEKYIDVDNYYRPITIPKYHATLGEDEDIRLPPHIDSFGIERLDKSLRDMTGMLYQDAHLLTHDADWWANLKEHCWTCRRAATRQSRKYQHQFSSVRAKLSHRKVTKIGDQIAGDYAVISDLCGRGEVHGARYLYTQKDLGIKKIDCVPTSKQDDKQTTEAMRHILGKHPRRNYFSDSQRCLHNGSRLCNLTPEKSLVGISGTNSIVEANNKTIISGTRKLLCQSGLPPCWWTYAAPCFCFHKNAVLDLNNEPVYYETHDHHFPGKLIPFGCMAYYVPVPTKDRRAKMEKRVCTGVFLGYRTSPGGKWEGDYLVADLNDFSGLSLHPKTEPGVFRNVQPHITRTVHWTKHGSHFPLFARSLEHNETIEGIQQCEVQMNRERRRRHHELQPTMSEDEVKAFRTFAKLKAVMSKPPDAGFDLQPEDAQSVEDNIPLDISAGLVNVDSATPWDHLE